MTTPSSEQRYIPLSKWNEHYPYPTVSGLRNLVFHADKNGFHKVIRRVGRRILIAEKSYFEWIEEQNAKGGAK